MTMESGGFDYTIEVRDKFTKALEEFKARLSEAHKAAQEFKTQQGAAAATSKQVSAALSETKKELQATARANKEAASTEGEASKAKGAHEKALRNIKKALRDQRIAAEELKIIEEKGLTLKARQASASSRAAKGFDAETEAAKRLKKAQEALAVEGIISGKLQGPARPPTPGPSQDIPKELASKAQRLLDTRRDQLKVEREIHELTQGPQRAPTSESQNIPKELASKAQLIAEAQRARLEVEKELQAIGLDARGNKILSEQEKLESKINQILERRKLLGRAKQELIDRGLVEPKAAKVPKGLEQEARESVASTVRALELRKLTKGIEEANPRIKELRRELGDTESVGNRISFTFRRLIGIFLAFRIVREISAQLRDAVKSSIDFNRQIEDSILGISALLVATGKVSSAQSDATSSAEEFALAQKEAKRQVELLRRENLRTAATFPELTKAFQTGVAPGLTNGLNIDEIREVTVLLSKAAAALGQPQNQLPEEIRSLLQGTITPRNTRIATALGITNEDIKRAKEMGQLFEFLQKRLESFNIAGDEGLKTFSIRLSNAKDAVQGLLAEGFQDFFQKLSDLLDFVGNKLIEIEGKDFINPEAVQAVEKLGTVLSLVVDEVKRIIQSLDAGDMEDIFQNVSTILKGIVSIVSIVVESLLKGLAIMSKIAAPLLKIIEAVSTALGPKLRAVLVTVLSIVVALKSAQLIFFSLPATIVGLVGKMLTLVTLSNTMKGHMLGTLIYAQTLGLTLKGIVITLAAIGAAFAIVFIGFSKLKKAYEERSGVSLTFFQFIEVAALHLKDVIVAVMMSSLDATMTFFRLGLVEAAKFFSFLITQAATLANLIPDMVAQWVPGLNAALTIMKEKLKDFANDMNAFIASEGKKGGIGGLIDRTKNRLSNANKNAVANARSTVAEEQLVPFSQQIEDLPSIIGATTREMESLISATETMQQEAESAKESFLISAATLRAQGAVLQQGKAIAEARTRIDKEGKLLEAQKLQAQHGLTQAKGEQLSLQQQINSLSLQDKTRISQAIGLTERVLQLKHQIAQEETQTALAKIDLAKADKSGDKSAIDKANKALSDSAAHTLDFKDALDKTKQSSDALFKDVAPDQKQKQMDLALGLVTAKGKERDAIRRVHEAESEVGKLRATVMDRAESKIAEIGILEAEESKKRIRELDDQVSAAQRLLAIRKSRSSDDEQLASSRNEIASESFRLAEIKKQNKADQDGLTMVIDLTKKLSGSKALILALQQQLNQLVEEGSKKELLASVAIQSATDSLGLVVEKQVEAHREFLMLTAAETKEVRAQIKAQEALVRTKGTASEFDDAVQQTKAEIDAQKVSLDLFKERAALEEMILLKQVQSTVDTDLKAEAQERLDTILARNVAKYQQMVVNLKLLRAELGRLIKDEASSALISGAESLTKRREAEARRRGKASEFEASQGASRFREEFVQLSANVALESHRLAQAKVAAKISEDRIRREIKESPLITTKLAKVVQLAALEQQNTAELKEQEELLKEAITLRDKLISQQDDPLRAGVMEGLRQFIKEAPTSFEIAVDAMKGSLQGLAQVGANIVTSWFDPRNTQSAEEQFADLLLSIGNNIFRGLFEQLLAQISGSVLSSLEGVGLVTGAEALTAAAGLWTGVVAGINEAAVALSAAASATAAAGAVSTVAQFEGGVTSGAAHGGRVTSRGVLRGFAQGGSRGSSRIDPRDIIPAMLRKGEEVVRPEGVEYGESLFGAGFFEDLNALRTPAALASIARMGVGVPSRASAGGGARQAQAASASRSSSSRPPAERVLVVDTPTWERMLAAGGAQPLLRFLDDNGFKPTTH